MSYIINFYHANLRLDLEVKVTDFTFLLCNFANFFPGVILRDVVTPLVKTDTGGPPFVGCPRQLIQYIHSYSPYLEAISSICNLRMNHALVTGDHLNMERVKHSK
jgi:hypothetical protein